MKAAILVNFSSKYNSGESNWHAIKEEVLSALPKETSVISYRVPFDIEECVKGLIVNEKTKCIISAGGDGSMNCVLNAIMKCKGETLKNIYLGAIGLGSNNDFLRPNPKTVKGIPCKINTHKPRFVDIGKATFRNKDLKKQTRYFIITASLGFTALSNLLFNEGDFIINKLKSLNLMNLAIYYTVLKTLLKYKNDHIVVRYESHEEKIRVTNLSIVKNPNITDNFRYDQDIRPDDGLLGVNYCYDMSKLGVINVLKDLMRGKFSGKPKRKSILTKNIKIDAEDFLLLETDGEVQLARDIEFSIMPKALQVLGN
jgi:diacylglycerol kinase family enzyme